MLKALRKEPHQRYASVDALSEDIQHHLDGRPVAARKGTFSYRTGKFVRRHWVGVSGALLILGAIVGGAVLATYGLVRARRAEAEALHQAAKATAINSSCRTPFSAQPHLGQGRETRVIDALAAAVPRIETAFRPSRDPAAVQHTIGRSYADLASSPKRSASPAVARHTATAARAEHVDVAESLHGMAALAFQKGDFKTAESLYREALEVDRRALGPDSMEVGAILNDLAMTLEEGKGDYDGAQPLLEESLAIKRAHLEPRDPDLAQSLNNLGMLYYRKKDYAKAEPLLREALARNRELRGDDNADVASGLNNVGLLLRTKGDYRGRPPTARPWRSIARSTDPCTPRSAERYNNLAFDLQKAGDLQEAETLFRESLAIYRQAYPQGHIQIPTTESLLGGCLTDLKRYPEAEPLLTSSYGVILKQFGPDHPRTQAARSRVIGLYEAWGKPQKAAAYRPLGRQPSSPGRSGGACASWAKRIIDTRSPSALSCEQTHTRPAIPPAALPACVSVRPTGDRSGKTIATGVNRIRPDRRAWPTEIKSIYLSQQGEKAMRRSCLCAGCLALAALPAALYGVPGDRAAGSPARTVAKDASTTSAPAEAAAVAHPAPQARGRSVQWVYVDPKTGRLTDRPAADARTTKALRDEAAAAAAPEVLEAMQGLTAAGGLVSCRLDDRSRASWSRRWGEGR